ncbi:MAG: glycosyltransferase family 39 protein [Patescibacteria group bacterium]|nr:glycosyltransferase family 39 protein [Patescibacteria group bacterium]
MRTIHQQIISLFFLVSCAVGLLTLLSKVNPSGLYFVDSGRYADLARNIVLHNQYSELFTFSPATQTQMYGWHVNLPPVHPLLISIMFRFFGINDLAVILESSFFFIISIFPLYFLAKKMFGQRVAIFSSLFYIFTPQLLSYAKDGASEPVFIFEILTISCLVIYKRNYYLLIAGLIASLMLLTKLQSYLFIGVFCIWILLVAKDRLKSLLFFLIGPVLVIFGNYLNILPYNYRLDFPVYLTLQQSSLYPGDNLPRIINASSTAIVTTKSYISIVVSKTLYDLYNFYKALNFSTNDLPDLASPVIVFAYFMSLVNFLHKEVLSVRIFRISLLLMLLGLLLISAITSPSIRYIQVCLPLMIVLAVAFYEQVFAAFHISKRLIDLSLLCLLVFYLGGTIFLQSTLDYRYLSKIFNYDKPYAQKVLGKNVGLLSSSNSVVVTNLDTWGSWYGDRKTILIPLTADQLEQMDKIQHIDVIFLTDYQKDNENHPLTGVWQTLYDHQVMTKNFVTSNFHLQATGTMKATDVYENTSYSYQLWERNIKDDQHN